MPTSNPQPNKPTLENHLALFVDYIECEEWHIHDDTDEHEGETAFGQHKDFDEIEAHLAIATAISSCVPEKKADLINARPSERSGYNQAIDDFTEALTAYLNPKQEETE